MTPDFSSPPMRTHRPPHASATLVLACVAATTWIAGCSLTDRWKPAERTESGAVTSQRAAQEEAEKTGTVLQGTSSSVPSLVPGEGNVQLAATFTTPDTAPTGDDFDDDDPGHLLARCRDRAARREWFDAVGDCRRSYQINPSSVAAQEELMKMLVTLQSYADAEVSARKVLAAKPNDTVALYYLAWSYRGREKFPEAIAALKRAVAIEPRRVEFLQALGITYCLSNDYGKGIATLNEALAIQPNNKDLSNGIASARSVLQDKLAPYEKLVQEKPDSWDNQAALGFMYQKYGLSQQALTAYDTTLAKMPSPLADQGDEARKIGAQVYYNRGVVYRDLGRPELAEPAFVQAMQLDSSLAAFCYYYIGLCRYDAGKYGESISALKKSVDLAPDAPDNRMALADAYAKAGKLSLAREQRSAAEEISARAEAKKAASAKQSADAAKAAENTPAALPPQGDSSDTAPQ